MRGRAKGLENICVYRFLKVADSFTELRMMRLTMWSQTAEETYRFIGEYTHPTAHRDVWEASE